MRILDFADGFSSASTPTIGALYTTSGTRASPNSITAGGGITASSSAKQLIFVQGSGGPVDITVNPQMTAGTSVGQEVTIIGRHDTNTVTLDDGTGLALNGPCVLSADSAITLVWDGSAWLEKNRNDI